MKPSRITIHCSATKDGKPCPAGKIKLWHLAAGWSDIGYHVIIQPSGQVEKYPGVGRPLNVQGAHVKRDNENNIGICLIGTSHFTAAQFVALRHELDAIRQVYSIPANQIYCHYEFESAKRQGKTCPNIRIADLLLWYILFDGTAINPYLIERKGVTGWRSSTDNVIDIKRNIKMKVEVEVSKEAYELGQGIAGVVGAVKLALADGWDTGTDLPAVITASLLHLAPAVQGLDLLDDEAKTDPVGFSKALALSVADAIGAALKK